MEKKREGEEGSGRSAGVHNYTRKGAKGSYIRNDLRFYREHVHGACKFTEAQHGNSALSTKQTSWIHGRQPELGQGPGRQRLQRTDGGGPERSAAHAGVELLDLIGLEVGPRPPLQAPRATRVSLLRSEPRLMECLETARVPTVLSCGPPLASHVPVLSKSPPGQAAVIAFYQVQVVGNHARPTANHQTSGDARIDG